MNTELTAHNNDSASAHVRVRRSSAACGRRTEDTGVTGWMLDSEG